MSKQHIKTSTGFECDVDKRVLDDFGFIKMLGAMVSGDEDQALPALQIFLLRCLARQMKSVCSSTLKKMVIPL